MEQFTHLTQIRSGLGIRGKGKKENRKRVKDIPCLTLEQRTAEYKHYTDLSVDDRKRISENLKKRPSNPIPHPQKEHFQEIILNLIRKQKIQETERKRLKSMKLHFYTLLVTSLILFIIIFTL